MTSSQRRFWQIHLSTALVMMIVAGIMMYVVVETIRVPAWNLNTAVQDFQTSAAQCPKAYRVVHLPESPTSAMAFVTRQDGTQAARFEVQQNTPFLIHGSNLFYVQADSITGATLTKIDLSNGERRWTTRIQGMDRGGAGLSPRSPHLGLKLLDEEITIFGTESSGRYIEILSAQSGEQLAHYIVEVNGVSHSAEPAFGIAAAISAALFAGVACESIFRLRKTRPGDIRSDK